jgi:hypothetical protein
MQSRYWFYGSQPPQFHLNPQALEKTPGGTLRFLFFDLSTGLAEMLAKSVAGICLAFRQVFGETQLLSERCPRPEHLCLRAFAFPNRGCRRRQFFHSLGRQKNAAIAPFIFSAAIVDHEDVTRFRAFHRFEENVDASEMFCRKRPAGKASAGRHGSDSTGARSEAESSGAKPRRRSGEWRGLRIFRRANDSSSGNVLFRIRLIKAPESAYPVKLPCLIAIFATATLAIVDLSTPPRFHEALWRKS